MDKQNYIKIYCFVETLIKYLNIFGLMSHFYQC